MDSALAYEKNAHAYLRGRDESLIGSQIVRQWAGALPKGAEVIDVACGGGYPITKEIVDAGLRLWAIDSSKTLIKKFQSRFQNIPTKCERVQDSNFFSRKFDAAVAIGLIFLFPESEQVAFIGQISKILEPGGRFLFTAPIENGTWSDMNTDIECHSLGYESYKDILEKSGFRIISTFVDKGKNNYYEAEKES